MMESDFRKVFEIADIVVPNCIEILYWEFRPIDRHFDASKVYHKYLSVSIIRTPDVLTICSPHSMYSRHQTRPNISAKSCANYSVDPGYLILACPFWSVSFVSVDSSLKEVAEASEMFRF